MAIALVYLLISLLSICHGYRSVKQAFTGSSVTSAPNHHYNNVLSVYQPHVYPSYLNLQVRYWSILQFKPSYCLFVDYAKVAVEQFVCSSTQEIPSESTRDRERSTQEETAQR
jgi:hypothetical protein